MTRQKLGLLFTTTVLSCIIVWAVHSHNGHSGNGSYHTIDHWNNSQGVLSGVRIKGGDGALGMHTWASVRVSLFHQTQESDYKASATFWYPATFSSLTGAYCLETDAPHHDDDEDGITQAYEEFSTAIYRSISSGLSLDEIASTDVDSEAQRCSASANAHGSSSSGNSHSTFAFAPFPSSWDD